MCVREWLYTHAMEYHHSARQRMNYPTLWQGKGVRHQGSWYDFIYMKLYKGDTESTGESKAVVAEVRWRAGHRELQG